MFTTIKCLAIYLPLDNQHNSDTTTNNGKHFLNVPPMPLVEDIANTLKQAAVSTPTYLHNSYNTHKPSCFSPVWAKNQLNKGNGTSEKEIDEWDETQKKIEDQVFSSHVEVIKRASLSSIESEERKDVLVDHPSSCSELYSDDGSCHGDELLSAYLDHATHIKSTFTVTSLIDFEHVLNDDTIDAPKVSAVITFLRANPQHSKAMLELFINKSKEVINKKPDGIKLIILFFDNLTFPELRSHFLSAVSPHHHHIFLILRIDPQACLRTKRHCRASFHPQIRPGETRNGEAPQCSNRS